MPNALGHGLAVQIAGPEDARLETADLLCDRSNVFGIDCRLHDRAVLRVWRINTAMLYPDFVQLGSAIPRHCRDGRPAGARDL